MKSTMNYTNFLTKTLLLLALSLTYFNAHATVEQKPAIDTDTISIDLVDAPLSDTIELAIRSLLSRNYILHPDLMNADKKVTLQLKDIEKNKALKIIETLLLEQGIQLTVNDEIVYVKPLKLQSDVIQPSPQTINEIPQIVQTQDVGLFQDEEIEKRVRLYEPKNKHPKDLTAILQMFNVPTSITGEGWLMYKTDDETEMQIRTIFKKIDVSPQQFEIIAATYEVSAQDDSQRSIDIIGEIFKNVGISIVTSGANNVIRFTGGSLFGAFKFFDSDTRFRSISKPYATVKSGQSMRFQSGQDVPVLGNITTNNNVTQQSIQYRQSGVILNVDVKASKDLIDLKINHELSNFVQTRIGVNQSPTLNKQSLNTSVAVHDKEILVIGGLSTKSGTVSRTTIAGLVPAEKIKTSKDNETYVFLQVNKINHDNLKENLTIPENIQQPEPIQQKPKPIYKEPFNPLQGT